MKISISETERERLLKHRLATNEDVRAVRESTRKGMLLAYYQIEVYPAIHFELGVGVLSLR